MTKLDIQDGSTLIEKVMAHFGWYKVQMTEMKCDNLDITYSFGYNIPENPLWPKDFKADDVKKALDKQYPKKPALKKATTRIKKNGN
jgi:hypothetical protein